MFESKYLPKALVQHRRASLATIKYLNFRLSNITKQLKRTLLHTAGKICLLNPFVVLKKAVPLVILALNLNNGTVHFRAHGTKCISSSALNIQALFLMDTNRWKSALKPTVTRVYWGLDTDEQRRRQKLVQIQCKLHKTLVEHIVKVQRRTLNCRQSIIFLFLLFLKSSESTSSS